MLSKDRERMVATRIVARGITDPLALDAVRTVPRERLARTSRERFAYDDGPARCGEGRARKLRPGSGPGGRLC